MSNATAPRPVATNPRRVLASPADYEMVGVDCHTPEWVYQAHLTALADDTARDLPLVLKSTIRLNRTMTTHLRCAARFRGRYQLAKFDRNLARSAEDWPGIADDQPVETAIGRWEPQEVSA